MNYDELLQEMKVTHEKKARDYSHEGSPFSNFTFAAELSSHFTNPVDRVFATIIGIKLARLAELQGKEAVNESVLDTYKDLTIYCSLWWQFNSKPPDEDEEIYPEKPGTIIEVPNPTLLDKIRGVRVTQDRSKRTETEKKLGDS